MSVTSLLRRAVGNGGATPCSRYGRDSEDCAPFAVAAFLVLEHANGEADDPAATLDWTMSLVVNDHDDPARVIVDYWHAVPIRLRRAIGGLRRVRSLASGVAS